MRYSIVIPTYNHCEDLLKPCLESIFKYTDMTDVELVISANGCTDSTDAYLKELTQRFTSIGFENHIRVVWNDKPLGYAAACNEGIVATRTDKIVLLNNDVILLPQVKGQWLQMLDQPLSNPKCGISGVLKLHSEVTQRDFIVFFCVMIRRQVFNRLGLLDTGFEVGGSEDIEFCVRAEHAGFEISECFEKTWDGTQWVNIFPIYHKGEGTMHDASLVPNYNEIFMRNTLELARRFNPEWYRRHAPNKLSWICDLGKEAEALYKEVIQENVYQVSEESLKNRAVIDIGANIGTFSMFAASLGASKVVAIEPVASTYDTLLDNIRRANAEQIVVAQKAVVLDEDNRSVQIGLNSESGHNSLYQASMGKETVSSVSLNSLLEMVDGDDVFLKMDCEGSEYDILMHVSPETMKRISTVAMEVHLDLHPVYQGVEVLEQKLASFGFKLADRKQMAAWEYNAQGEMINYRPIPRTNEIWVRA